MLDKKFGVLLLLGLFCIGFVVAATWGSIIGGDDAEVILNSPADESTAFNNPVTFNATANVTGGATLVNMSLWTNETGSWEIRNATSLSSAISGLVSYYRLDDNLATTNVIDDLISNDGTSTINTENLYYASGKIESAFDFVSANSEKVDMGFISQPSTAMTVSFWFNADVMPTTEDDILVSKFLDGGDERSWLIGIQDGAVKAYTSSDGTFQPGNSLNSGVIISTGNWYHVVYRYNGSELTLWVNGSEVDNFAFSSDIYDGSAKTQFAHYEDGSSLAYYDGKLDEVGIWNRSLSNAEIEELYNSGTANRPTTTTKIQTFQRTITESTLWNVQVCDSDGDCGFAPANYTVHLDTGAPIITVENPTGILDYNAIGLNETLNVTFTDSNLDSCWYNYNGTNITIDGCLTGVKNSTEFILDADNLNMTLYTNDSLGNLNSTFIEWNYKILELNLTYNEEVLDLSLEDFILYAQASEEITASKLHYNGNTYDSSILSLGSGLYKISNSIQIPDVAVDTNFTFFFNITTSTDTFTTQSNNQSVFVLLIDNCASYTNEIFNISLFDEKTLLDLLGTIEVNLELFNTDKSTALTTAVANFYNMSNMAICSNVNLTDTGYYYDLELRYYVDPTNTSTFLYVPEFYHIQKASTANFPQSLNLYNLNINESTEFTMFYRDNNYVARPNVLLQIERKYISEGLFRTVEIPITSSEGNAIGHFDLNNYKYKIIATQDGEVLNVFDNPAIVCESELSGLCTLTLNGQGSPNPFEDYDTIQDISYAISLNDTEITIDYVIPSGETRQVNVYMYQSSSFRDDLTLCNQTLTSSAGSFICDANATIGDSNVFIEIRVDGVLESRNKVYYQEDLGDYFNLNNYAIAALFLILLITMMVSSPMIMVSTAIFSVALLGFVFLLKGSSIGLVLGSFSWLVVAGILILLKLNKKDET